MRGSQCEASSAFWITTTVCSKPTPECKDTE